MIRLKIPFTAFERSDFSLEIPEYFVHFFKARERVGVALYNFHHRADLPFIHYANEHIFVGVRIHSVHFYLRYAVFEFGNQLRGQFVRRTCYDLEFITVFDTAQSVIHHYIRDKQVDQGTDNGRYFHTVHEKRDRHDACIHYKRNVSDIDLGSDLFDQRGDPVRSAARAEPAQHQGNSEPRNNARRHAGKYDSKIVAVIRQAIRQRADRVVKPRRKRLHDHINAQHQAQFFVYENADQNKDRQIERHHQDRPTYFALDKMIGNGRETAYPSGRKTVAVLKKMVCRTDDHARDDRAEYIQDQFFDGYLFPHNLPFFLKISFTYILIFNVFKSLTYNFCPVDEKLPVLRTGK